MYRLKHNHDSSSFVCLNVKKTTKKKKREKKKVLLTIPRKRYSEKALASSNDITFKEKPQTSSGIQTCEDCVCVCVCL